MGRPAQTPARTWIDEGLRALADGGPGAVRVEALARVLGVTKGGFYNHFEGRSALLKEMLDTWEAIVAHEPIKQAEGAEGDARAKLQRLIDIASSSSDLIEIDLSIRDWARHDKIVARRLERVDTRRIKYLRSLFSAFCSDPAEVEVRCLMAFSVYLAPARIAADHGPLGRAEVRRLALERLLE